MNNTNCLTFITNNITGTQNNSKRLSVVKYLKNKQEVPGLEAFAFLS